MTTADRFKLLSLTAGGLGLMKPASGTWGSTPPPAIFAVMILAGASLESVRVVMIVLLLLATAACVAFTKWGEQRWGKKDAGQIVADEVAGMCLPLLIVPAVSEPTSGPGFLRLTIVLAVAFLLFRFFDIAKLQPANAAQKLPHGWGVLVDDLVAGLYATIALAVGLRLLW